MATGLEILGGVAAAVQLTQLMARFIRNFGTLQNAPRQVKRLERILDDLNDDNLIQAASIRERERLWDLILVAEETLQRSLNEPPNRLLQFFWPEESEKRLKDQNDELQYELITVGLRVDRRRWELYQSDVVPTSPGAAALSPPPYASHGSDQTVYQPPSHPLSAPNETVLDAGSSSSERHKLPAKLYLQDPLGTTVVGPLEAKYHRVLERDEETRLIQYERKTQHGHLKVTHRIPRGCLRFEDDKLDDKEVHFLDAHPVTVVRSGTGHEVYVLHPKYKFGSPDEREAFLAHMLERELLGRFYAEEILYRGHLHARGKVIRLWRKEEQMRSGETRVATKLTFLARGERQFEWDLARLSRTVVVDGDWATLVECDAEGRISDNTAILAIRFRHQRGKTVSGKSERRKSVAPEDEERDEDPATKKRTSSWTKHVRAFSFSRSGGVIDKGKARKNSLGKLPESIPSTSSSGKVEGEDVGNDDDVTTPASVQNSDAEAFKAMFLQFHPSSVPELAQLPPLAMPPVWDPGEFGGFGPRIY
ncbi:hypothetical protein QBC35DRAFT_509668 [Podospora australis]|uniref:Uncharacterized protein n=1 Tax=Podospora australis TaxID=1536484 RepID=A0AAN6WIS4_9PEZI|nr:hypothetical protein QBC35DRAFT_509668 [Podospora australis]